VASPLFFISKQFPQLRCSLYFLIRYRSGLCRGLQTFQIYSSYYGKNRKQPNYINCALSKLLLITRKTTKRKGTLMPTILLLVILFIAYAFYISWDNPVITHYNDTSTTTPSAAPITRPVIIKTPHRSWEAPAPTKSIDYVSYITSTTWRENPSRLQALSNDNYSCRMCGDDLTIQVHHITYANLGNELPEDLAVLCQDCHNHTHLMAGKGAILYPPIKHPSKENS